MAAVMCDAGHAGHSHASQVTMRRFDDVGAALAFAARSPCENPACAGLHIAAWRGRGGQLGGVRIFGQPASAPLAEELEALYRRPRPEPVAWPAPVVLNEPLPPRGATH